MSDPVVKAMRVEFVYDDGTGLTTTIRFDPPIPWDEPVVFADLFKDMKWERTERTELAGPMPRRLSPLWGERGYG